MPLLEDCLSKFENEEKYIHDRRLCKLWIKYVSYKHCVAKQLTIHKLTHCSFCRLICNRIHWSYFSCCIQRVYVCLVLICSGPGPIIMKLPVIISVLMLCLSWVSVHWLSRMKIWCWLGSKFNYFIYYEEIVNL